MARRRALLVVGGVLAGALAAGWAVWRPRPSGPVVAPAAPNAPADPQYASTIQPIFDRRCVPCHACFDSPCQLNLQSFEGLDRGGNKAIVYHPGAPDAGAADTHVPGRADHDGVAVGFRVLSGRGPRRAGRSRSLDAVALRQAARRRPRALASSTSTRRRRAPAAPPRLERRAARSTPSVECHSACRRWRRSEREALGQRGCVRGAGGTPGDPEEGEAARRVIATWEAFFNGSDPRAPLVSAYLFEHLFYAHLYFADVAGELVSPRSLAHAPRRTHRRDRDAPSLRRPGHQHLLLPAPAHPRDAGAQDARAVRAGRREARAAAPPLLRASVGRARTVSRSIARAPTPS